MPKLWPLSQSQFTPAIQLHVYMHNTTEIIQTPHIQTIIMPQYCTILFSNVLGCCSQLGRLCTLHTISSQLFSLVGSTFPISSCNSLPCCMADTNQPQLTTSMHRLLGMRQSNHSQRLCSSEKKYLLQDQNH